jgi:hypothetical protein
MFSLTGASLLSPWFFFAGVGDIASLFIAGMHSVGIKVSYFMYKFLNSPDAFKTGY